MGGMMGGEGPDFASTMDGMMGGDDGGGEALFGSSRGRKGGSRGGSGMDFASMMAMMDAAD
eukprot:534391-Pelagomonas_calceolata.AAC.1